MSHDRVMCSACRLIIALPFCFRNNGSSACKERPSKQMKGFCYHNSDDQRDKGCHRAPM
eukprot:CAMPEP_0177775932 /NCGR_PEP_ID=MMETSP0491_2-20121128/14410_1 /TAXON_ID=63592 /ORGANISM="Tetraselmis chuii, Strain PLY429" /LENGTH=58 /DNA_ID=CAMNT_0019294623 /DNA_START=23 /DNA_END=196 /DNA_ORIENTATION=-